MNQLIFDIGLHTGMDTDFYLKKGFTVLGVEANPKLANFCREKFQSEILEKKLRIVEKAITELHGDSCTFYINEEKNDWSSLIIGEAHKGSNAMITPVEVSTTRLENLISEFGLPYYLKCDIEGGDLEVSKQLSELPETPNFCSFEITNGEIINNLLKAGYVKFQLVNQFLNGFTTAPNPSKEGVYVYAKFNGHTSGLFGRDLKDDRWLDSNKATDLFNKFVDLRDSYSELCVGWLDIHACK